MKYIVATSDNKYYRWQMLVQIHNFKEMGMLDDLIYVVAKTNKRKSKYLGYIEKECGVEIHAFNDDRKSSLYTPSVTAHVMKKFLKKYPKQGDIFFYLDPDVLFTEKPEFNGSIINNDVWYISDTKSYLDSKYIKSKSNELFKEMCDIVGISSDVVEANDREAGGAQYIIKNTNYKFWNKVEEDSEKLYAHMDKTSNKYNPKFPIQKWTAEMWAVLWNAWYFGHRTKIWNELSFNWATTEIDRLNDHKIFHNAGVFDQEDLFNKVKFTNKNPFDGKYDHVSEKYCSKYYVDNILDTSDNYSKLVNKL